MSLVLPQKLAACLEVLYCATIRLRRLGYSGEQTGLTPEAASEIVAVTDAVHNLPHHEQLMGTLPVRHGSGLGGHH